MYPMSEMDGRIEKTGVSPHWTKDFSQEHISNIIKSFQTSHNNSTESLNKNMAELRAFNAFQRRVSSAQHSRTQKDLVETKLYGRLTNVTFY